MVCRLYLSNTSGLATNTEPAVRKWQLPALPNGGTYYNHPMLVRFVFSINNQGIWVRKARAMKATAAYMLNMMKTVLLSGTIYKYCHFRNLPSYGRNRYIKLCDNEIGKLTKCFIQILWHRMNCFVGYTPWICHGSMARLFQSLYGIG